MITITPTTRSSFRVRIAATVLATGVLSFGLATGAGHAESASDCLWAGQTHVRGATVVAGGWEFTCATAAFGVAQWDRGARTDRRSTVPNPGADSHPAGKFTAGARQPGTDYNDYCVGDQLIEGREDIYEVRRDGNGVLYWKAAGPISEWQPDDTVQPPSWRTSSLCRDGELI